MRRAAVIALLAAALFMVSPGIASSPRPVIASTSSATVTGYFCAATCTGILGPGGGTLSLAPGIPSVLAINAGNVLLFGRKIGVYVDNEVPLQCQVVAAELKLFPLVIAGNAPNSAVSDRCPGAINALEWYPYAGAGVKPLAIPRANAFILAYRFHWPGQPSPTPKQRATLLAQALKFRPQLILWY